MAVTPADFTDREAARPLIETVLAEHSRLQKLWADGNYSGELVEWANGLRAEVKLAGGVRKALLKSMALKWLPEEIVNRRKVGFEMPLGEWLRPGGALSHRVQALRDAESFAARVTDRKAIEQLITEHNSSTANHADILWTLIALDVWAQVFLGNRVRSERLPGAETGKSLELIGGAR